MNPTQFAQFAKAKYCLCRACNTPTTLDMEVDGENYKGIELCRSCLVQSLNENKQN